MGDEGSIRLNCVDTHYCDVAMEEELITHAVFLLFLGFDAMTIPS